MATGHGVQIECPRCQGKGWTMRRPEVDDPDDWAWCSTCLASGVVDELGAMVHELGLLSEED